MAAWYRTGTVSITNGTAAVVGVGTQWLGQIQPGSLLIVGSAFAEVLSVTDNTHLTLRQNWSSGTVSGSAYAIVTSLGDLTNADLAARVAGMVDGWQGTLDDWIAYLSGDDVVDLPDGQGGTMTVKTPKHISDLAAGVLNKALSGVSTVVLSAAEARNAYLNFTGTPAAALAVQIPQAFRLYYVRNATSQALTIKTAVGAGVALAPGTSLVLVCDSVDVSTIDTGVRTVFAAADDIANANLPVPNIFVKPSESDMLNVPWQYWDGYQLCGLGGTLFCPVTVDDGATFQTARIQAVLNKAKPGQAVSLPAPTLLKRAVKAATLVIPTGVSLVSAGAILLGATLTFSPSTAQAFNSSVSNMWLKQCKVRIESPGDAGKPTSVGTNTLTDTTKAWTTNQWVGYSVSIVAGVGKGQAWRRIVSNTATTLTLDANWPTTPNTSSDYRIVCNMSAINIDHCFLDGTSITDSGQTSGDAVFIGQFGFDIRFTRGTQICNYGGWGVHCIGNTQLDGAGEPHLATGVNLNMSDTKIFNCGSLGAGGTSTGSNTTTTLRDTTKNWTVNQHAGKTVFITSGTGSGQNRIVISNTSNTLTISGFTPWVTLPDATSQYDFVYGGCIRLFGAPKDGGSLHMSNVLLDHGLQALVADNTIMGDCNNYTDTGTSTGGNTTTTLNDTGSAWPTNQFYGYWVTLTGGTGYVPGSKTTRRIVSNTATQLNIDPTTPWDTVPDATTTYSIDSASGGWIITGSGVRVELCGQINGVANHDLPAILLRRASMTVVGFWYSSDIGTALYRNIDVQQGQFYGFGGRMLKGASTAVGVYVRPDTKGNEAILHMPQAPAEYNVGCSKFVTTADNATQGRLAALRFRFTKGATGLTAQRVSGAGIGIGGSTDERWSTLLSDEFVNGGASVNVGNVLDKVYYQMSAGGGQINVTLAYRQITSAVGSQINKNATGITNIYSDVKLVNGTANFSIIFTDADGDEINLPSVLTTGKYIEVTAWVTLQGL